MRNKISLNLLLAWIWPFISVGPFYNGVVAGFCEYRVNIEWLSLHWIQAGQWSRLRPPLWAKTQVDRCSWLAIGNDKVTTSFTTKHSIKSTKPGWRQQWGLNVWTFTQLYVTEKYVILKLQFELYQEKRAVPAKLMASNQHLDRPAEHRRL